MGKTEREYAGDISEIHPAQQGRRLLSKRWRLCA